MTCENPGDTRARLPSSCGGWRSAKDVLVALHAQAPAAYLHGAAVTVATRRRARGRRPWSRGRALPLRELHGSGIRTMLGVETREGHPGEGSSMEDVGWGWIYREPEALFRRVEALGGGRPFRGPECGIFPSIFLSTWKLLLLPVPSLIRFWVFKGYSMLLRFFLWMWSWSGLTKHGLESWLAVLT